MVTATVVVRVQKAGFFEDLCVANDVIISHILDDENFAFYEAMGDAENIFLVGVGIGIEMGEQIMYDACMKPNDN